MAETLQDLSTYAKDLILEAGELIRASFPRTLDITTKSNPNDLVTNMDKEIEQFFIERIKKTYPSHRILGEEGYGDEIERLDGYVWMIDPIDGTMNFIHQQRNFAVSVGIYQDGIGQVGLIYDVVSDELYHAVKGEGLTVNGEQLPRLEETRVSESIIALNAFWLTKNRRLPDGLLTPLARDARGTRSYGSAALELVYVATGRVDAYMSPRLSPWDIAAGIIMVEEAGGVATDMRGKELTLLGESSLFVARPGLHQEIIENYLKRGEW